MKITSKGQVTIPREIRDKSGLLPGSEVDFSIKDDKVVLTAVRGKGRGEALVARMKGRGNVKMTTDEIMRLTRGDR